MDDSILNRRLTAKEKKTIEAIETNAKKRPLKRKLTVAWVIENLVLDRHCFKEGDSIDCKQDAIDLLDAMIEVARKCGTETEKGLEQWKKYIMKTYISGDKYPEDDD